MTTGERIKLSREQKGISQAELARKLGISRSSVNAWESGLSAPTAAYLIELSRLFHVSTDYLLGIEKGNQLNLAGYSREELKLINNLISYIDKQHN